MNHKIKLTHTYNWMDDGLKKKYIYIYIYIYSFLCEKYILFTNAVEYNIVYIKYILK